ncbi:alpha/beta fold hydrolase [Pontibacter diazotrophicus]|uniref:Alpha/beta fold hydrolase n=1 Tax=Pontibacter diazotrophicus TaxID=1400979 RepID=A0A3D8LB05_9BACT|nr:alpha/beta fold hydrolase [Pontibacter diazotrophicus]RDV14585.1 alpha/beta fold hydrolase [Pontibacter diazotrophicus]
MGLLSFQQERMIFFPQKLTADHAFRFNQEFEEIYIPTKDGVKLHGLLFKAAEPKGLVFYLHGNAGSVDSWGLIAQTYTDLNYDLFLLDYRGYGKSEGSISSERQFYEDVQAAYDQLKLIYTENQIIIAGYSIGTGPAAMLASVNKPKLLLLQAPYYSLGNLMQNLYPFVPAFLLNYKFETFRFVEKTEAPIAVFHGKEDEIIYPGSSEKLKAHLKPGDKVIFLEGQGHNGMNENPAYQKELAEVLNAAD